jgi:hypothetical protein
VGRPEVPALPVAFGPADPSVVPELTQAFLDSPGAAGLSFLRLARAGFRA